MDKLEMFLERVASRIRTEGYEYPRNSVKYRNMTEFQKKDFRFGGFRLIDLSLSKILDRINEKVFEFTEEENIEFENIILEGLYELENIISPYKIGQRFHWKETQSYTSGGNITANSVMKAALHGNDTYDINVIVEILEINGDNLICLNKRNYYAMRETVNWKLNKIRLVGDNNV